MQWPALHENRCCCAHLFSGMMQAGDRQCCSHLVQVEDGLLEELGAPLEAAHPGLDLQAGSVTVTSGIFALVWEALIATTQPAGVKEQHQLHSIHAGSAHSCLAQEALCLMSLPRGRMQLTVEGGCSQQSGKAIANHVHTCSARSSAVKSAALPPLKALNRSSTSSILHTKEHL